MKNNLTVKQLNSYIKNVFEDELILQDIVVTGEVFEISHSKYAYITLKEDDCLLNCVCFNRIPLPQQGERVALGGSVSYYEKWGKVSFIVKSIDIIGDGLCQAEYLKLKEKLKNNGFFDKKLPLPTFISKVCIITSGYGSVIHDFLSGISDGHSYIDITVLNSSVQGSSAIDDITQNLAKADKKFDVVVIARGGGSAADLECFNTEKVAFAVANMHVPVISAVGHETDYTLCDLCASYRAGTPSFAAKKITENNQIIIERFIDCTKKISEVINRRVKDKATLLGLLTSRVIMAASDELTSAKSKLLRLSDRLLPAAESLLSKKKNDIEKFMGSASNVIEKKNSAAQTTLQTCAVKLEYLSPLKIIASGYAVAERNGSTVTSARDCEVGDTIDVRFFDGHVTADIKQKEID